MSGFVFGVVVGVVINLVTALFSREKALRVLPWLIFYILAHGTFVALQSGPTWRGMMWLTKRFENYAVLSYVVVILISGCLGTLYLRAAKLAVEHLEGHTSETDPAAPHNDPENRHTDLFLDCNMVPLPVTLREGQPVHSIDLAWPGTGWRMNSGTGGDARWPYEKPEGLSGYKCEITNFRPMPLFDLILHFPAMQFDPQGALPPSQIV